MRQQCLGNTRLQAARLAPSACGCIRPSRLDGFPRISAEKPDPYQHSATEHHQHCELRPGFHYFRLDRCQIPLGERPYKLAVQPNQRQRSYKEKHQGKRADPHRVEQHHGPVIDAIAFRCWQCRLCRRPAWNSCRTADRQLRTGRAAHWTHGRSRWRRRAHIPQPTMTPSIYAATERTCTPEHGLGLPSKATRHRGDNWEVQHQLF